MGKIFKSGFAYRGTMKPADAILVYNSDTEVDEYAQAGSHYYAILSTSNV